MNPVSAPEAKKDTAVQPRTPDPSPFGPSLEPVSPNGKPFSAPKTDKEELAIKKNLGVMLAGAAIAVVAVMLVLMKIPHRHPPATSMALVIASHKAEPSPTPAPAQASTALPISDAEDGHPREQANEGDAVGPQDVAHTAKPIAQQTLPGNLGAIPQGPWEAPNSPGNAQPTDQDIAPISADARAEHDALDKPSLVFVRKQTAASSTPAANVAPLDIGIGLPPGTRLRARLETAVNTAVMTPVVAVVEYNYEQHGEIVVPAGTKVFGHLDSADSSGFVGVRFDSMMLPDGSSVSLEAAATDLQFRPLRGRVEGRHRGKNILVRSVSGVGEIAAALAGRGSLNQPLSESDVLRERVSDNIAQASDQEVNKLAATEHLVISVAANTEIYVVLQKPAKAQSGLNSDASTQAPQTSYRQNLEQLQQLLQLQKELSQEASAQSSNP